MNSISSRPSVPLNARKVGRVASPTPIVPSWEDSTSTISSIRRPTTAARAAAAIHPALPPPTMTILRMAEPAITQPCRSQCSAQLHRERPPAAIPLERVRTDMLLCQRSVDRIRQVQRLEPEGDVGSDVVEHRGIELAVGVSKHGHPPCHILLTVLMVGIGAIGVGDGPIGTLERVDVRAQQILAAP